MRKIALALLFAAGCASAPPPKPAQACVAEAPAKVRMEYMAPPAPVTGTTGDGTKVDGVITVVTADSLVAFVEYLDKLEKIAQRAASGCVAK